MKLVADITKRSRFRPDPPRDRVKILTDRRQAEIVQIARFVARFGLVAAIAGYLWIAKPDFASAPQPFSVAAQGALAFVTEEERRLETQLQEVERQIQVFDQSIQRTRGQARSLTRDVTLLDSEIRKLNLQIAATDLQVKRLAARIKNTQEAIYESQLKIARQRESLAHSLQAIHEADQVSLLEMMLAYASIADFFSNLNAIYALQLRAQIELDQVYALRQVLARQETELSEAKEEQTAFLLIQRSQRTEVASTRQTKNQLLAQTRGQEARYAELRRSAEQTAAQIRAQLFRLRGGGELSFGDAYQLAKAAGEATGVRPALIMAVISQESALGRNVGRCTYNQITRRGTTVMNPNQHEAFRQIVRELGKNPETVPVSCPIFADGTFGGAMGIPQFMPLTWMSVRDRIQQIVGHRPSPWDPRAAFVATALYLADNGAAAGTIEAERIAAARYYAGGNWRRFLWSYGESVMRITRRFQAQIDILERDPR